MAWRTVDSDEHKILISTQVLLMMHALTRDGQVRVDRDEASRCLIERGGTTSQVHALAGATSASGSSKRPDLMGEVFTRCGVFPSGRRVAS